MTPVTENQTIQRMRPALRQPGFKDRPGGLGPGPSTGTGSGGCSLTQGGILSRAGAGASKSLAEREVERVALEVQAAVIPVRAVDADAGGEGHRPAVHVRSGRLGELVLGIDDVG